MNSPEGKRLERLVAAIHHAESTGAVVTWNDKINGRQFDVTVRFKFGLHSYLTVIECKDYSSKVSVDKADAFVTKARDVNANKAILISSMGFQSGCFSVAERHGIQLLVLSETTDTSIPELVERLTPGLSIYDVCFLETRSNGTVDFEDWGGRLSYLMNHSKLVSAEGERTPNQLIYEWQLVQPSSILIKRLGFSSLCRSGRAYASHMAKLCQSAQCSSPVHLWNWLYQSGRCWTIMSCRGCAHE